MLLFFNFKLQCMRVGCASFPMSFENQTNSFIAFVKSNQIVSRSLYVTFQEESQFKGIKTYIFSTPDSLLAGKRTNPDNACFCMEEDEDLAEKRCTLDGIFDASGCQKGIPLIISLPHFMGADKRITDNIEGLKPNATAHRPELHVEPVRLTYFIYTLLVAIVFFSIYIIISMLLSFLFIIIIIVLQL